jgi:hypothetical protein
MAESIGILLIGGGLTGLIIRTFVLEEHGFKVTAVDNYKAAGPLLRRTDLVILDWTSEDSAGGFRFLRETSPKLPVIVIASTPLSEPVREAAAAVIAHSALASSLLPIVQLAMHPRNRPKTRTPSKVRLGIGDDFVSVGQHLLLFWESEVELQCLANFLTAGLDMDDQLVLCGPSTANTRLANMLDEHGLNADELSSRGKLSVIEAEGAETAVPQLVELMQSPEHKQDGGVIRVVGTAAGWDQAIAEESLIRHECDLDRALSGCACVTICPYRTWGMSSRTIIHGALWNHASVIVNNTVKDNPFYKPLN